MKESLGIFVNSWPDHFYQRDIKSPETAIACSKAARGSLQRSESALRAEAEIIARDVVSDLEQPDSVTNLRTLSHTIFPQVFGMLGALQGIYGEDGGSASYPKEVMKGIRAFLSTLHEIWIKSAHQPLQNLAKAIQSGIAVRDAGVAAILRTPEAAVKA